MAVVNRFFLVLVFLFTLSGCDSLSRKSTLVYGIDIHNYGQNGVLILDMHRIKKYTEKVVFVTYRKTGEEIRNPGTKGLAGMTLVKRLYPRVPHKYRDPTSAFGRFPGYPNSLPEEIEVKWQLAELSECSKNLGVEPDSKIGKEVQDRGYNPLDHVIKSDCTWTPLPDKIFTQKVDMAKLKASEAYQRTDTRAEGSGGRYTLNLSFIFMEDELKVEAKNGVTNKWR